MTEPQPGLGEPLSAQMYQTLRRGIILGEYPQGSALKEARVADELAVSRIPIRAAIPHLENEGFLTTAPRRSARVTTWTGRAVNELFDVRLSIESLAARQAATAVREGASTDALTASLDLAHAAVASGERLAIAEAHTTYHERIVELAGNELLASIMRGVLGRMTWLFYLTAERDPAGQSHEHDELVEVIGSGNDRLAESIAFAHIEKGRAPSLEILLRTD
ncbi:GntR family transcriptional regulator [Promicromonospora sukumoe]